MFFKRKKHVTNWDVLGAVIWYTKRFDVECLLTQQQLPLEPEPRKVSTYETLTVDEELLDNFHRNLHYSREAFIKYRAKFLNAYYAQKNDSHTGAGLQKLLSKMKILPTWSLLSGISNTTTSAQCGRVFQMSCAT